MSFEQAAALPLVVTTGAGDIPDDLMIPFIICGEKSVELLNGRRLLVRPSQARCLWLYAVFKGTRFHLRSSRQVKSNRAALHVDDWVVTVLPNGRGGQTDHVFSLHLLYYLLEGYRRKMMAFVNDNVPILSDQILRPPPFRCKL